MNHLGKTLACQKAKFIDKMGNTLTLVEPPEGQPATIKALETDDQKTISRFLPVEAIENAVRRPVVFETRGEVFDKEWLMQGQQFEAGGVLYRVETRHPDRRQDVCVTLNIVAYPD